MAYLALAAVTEPRNLEKETNKKHQNMSLNKALLIGHVGAVPEVRYVGAAGTQNAKVAQFRLATTERYKDKDGNVKENTEWHNIVAWRGLADLTEKYIVKGTLLYIEGHLKLRVWETQNGEKRYQTDIVADKIDLLSRPKDSATEGARQMSQQQPQQQVNNYSAPQNSNTYVRQAAQAQYPESAQQYQQSIIDSDNLPSDNLPF